jgi:hypothetical protein
MACLLRDLAQCLAFGRPSGNPIILQGLSPGPHIVHITLVDANHRPLDKAK